MDALFFKTGKFSTLIDTGKLSNNFIELLPLIRPIISLGARLDGGNQNMDMIQADNAFQNLYLKGFTSLPNQFTNFPANVTLQHLLTILCDKYKMLLNFKNSMTSITVIHKAPTFQFRAISYVKKS